MWRLTLSNAIAHRSRLALTWVAVALGVGDTLVAALTSRGWVAYR